MRAMNSIAFVLGTSIIVATSAGCSGGASKSQTSQAASTSATSFSGTYTAQSASPAFFSTLTLNAIDQSYTANLVDSNGASSPSSGSYAISSDAFPTLTLSPDDGSSNQVFSIIAEHISGSPADNILLSQGSSSEVMVPSASAPAALPAAASSFIGNWLAVNSSSPELGINDIGLNADATYDGQFNGAVQNGTWTLTGDSFFTLVLTPSSGDPESYSIILSQIPGGPVGIQLTQSGTTEQLTTTH
jgi:hypothetical protein